MSLEELIGVGVGDDETTIHRHRSIHGPLTHNSLMEKRGETEGRNNHTRTQRLTWFGGRHPPMSTAVANPWNFRILSMIQYRDDNPFFRETREK